MLYIKLNIDDSTVYPGKRLGKDYPPEYLDDFCKYLVKIMKSEFKKAIDNQRYSYRWKPLSVNYIRYKKMHNLSLKTWEATGLLYDSIVYRKRNGYYMVGIDTRKRYKNGAKVLDIAKCLEYGTSTIPARPLFRPIFTYMRKNMSRYWKKFLREEKHINEP